MRSFQTTMVIEIVSSREEEEGLEGMYLTNNQHDKINTAIVKMLNDFQRENSVGAVEARVVSTHNTEVPSGIRRRRGIFGVIVRDRFSMVTEWNRSMRQMYLSRYTDKEAFETINKWKHMIVSTRRDSGQVIINFPEIDDDRAQEVWNRVWYPLQDEFEHKFWKTVRNEILNDYDGDYEDGLMERLRNAQIETDIDYGLSCTRHSNQNGQSQVDDDIF